jgi:hypothetical protein
MAQAPTVRVESTSPARGRRSGEAIVWSVIVMLLSAILLISSGGLLQLLQ